MRQEILKASADLFRANGFLGVSMGDVASRVSISKANIYTYFRNKQHLLYEVLCAASEHTINEARLIMESSASPENKLKDLVWLQARSETSSGDFQLSGIHVFERRNLPPALRKKYDCIRDQYEQIFREALKGAISTGYFKECDVSLTARLILGLINYVPYWFRRDGPLSAEDVAAQIWELITHGLLCEAGGNKEATA